MTHKEEKSTYREIVAANLLSRRLMPGDALTVMVRNEESGDSVFTRAERLRDLFLSSFAFFPQEIALHPDHLSILRRQGKSLDVTIPESVARAVGALVDLDDLPRHVPLVGDPALDLFTLVARYTFEMGDAKEMALLMLRAVYPDVFGSGGKSPL